MPCLGVGLDLAGRLAAAGCRPQPPATGRHPAAIGRCRPMPATTSRRWPLQLRLWLRLWLRALREAAGKEAAEITGKHWEPEGSTGN